jgi:CHAT domain-containing protein
MSIPDAFRSAQGEMREKYQSPYFWAGFVLVE